MRKKRVEAGSNPIEADPDRQQYLDSLLPEDDDFETFGPSEEEFGLASVSYVTRYFTTDIRPQLLLLVTVLRKRRAEMPRNLLPYRDLVDLIVRATGDEEGKVTNTLLRDLQIDGVISVNRRHHVSIKI